MEEIHQGTAPITQEFIQQKELEGWQLNKQQDHPQILTFTKIVRYNSSFLYVCNLWKEKGKSACLYNHKRPQRVIDHQQSSKHNKQVQTEEDILCEKTRKLTIYQAQRKGKRLDINLFITLILYYSCK